MMSDTSLDWWTIPWNELHDIRVTLVRGNGPQPGPRSLGGRLEPDPADRVLSVKGTPVFHRLPDHRGGLDVRIGVIRRRATPNDMDWWVGRFAFELADMPVTILTTSQLVLRGRLHSDGRAMTVGGVPVLTVDRWNIVTGSTPMVRLVLRGTPGISQSYDLLADGRLVRVYPDGQPPVLCRLERRNNRLTVTGTNLTVYTAPLTPHPDILYVDPTPTADLPTIDEHPEPTSVRFPGFRPFGHLDQDKWIAQKTLEEAAELTEASKQWLKHPNPLTRRDMLDEMADLLQTLTNLTAAYHITERELVEAAQRCEQKNQMRKKGTN